jgi:hypothetical protein
MVASIATLAAAIVVAVGVVASAAGLNSIPNPGKLGPASGTPITGKKGHATCDEPGQPTCPPVATDWSAAASNSPTDILAALSANPGYMSPIEADGMAPANSTYTFDTPVLVLPATAGAGGDYYTLPHYLIRASVNGIRGITYDVLYNPSTQQIHISSVSGMNPPNDPHYNKPFPYDGVSSSAAVSALQAAKGLSPASGYQPQLVFFYEDPKVVSPANPSGWFGGGESPADPIWRLKGADGHLYFVGIDGHTYLPAQLPVAPGTSLVQP